MPLVVKDGGRENTGIHILMYADGVALHAALSEIMLVTFELPRG